MKNKNKRSWLAYCSDFCTKFDITKFPEYYEPNLLKFEKYNDYMKIKLK